MMITEFKYKIIRLKILNMIRKILLVLQTQKVDLI
jgi:hypothetical protein